MPQNETPVARGSFWFNFVTFNTSCSNSCLWTVFTSQSHLSKWQLLTVRILSLLPKGARNKKLTFWGHDSNMEQTRGNQKVKKVGFGQVSYTLSLLSAFPGQNNSHRGKRILAIDECHHLLLHVAGPAAGGTFAPYRFWSRRLFQGGTPTTWHDGGLFSLVSLGTANKGVSTPNRTRYGHSLSPAYRGQPTESSMVQKLAKRCNQGVSRSQHQLNSKNCLARIRPKPNSRSHLFTSPPECHYCSKQ